MSKLDKKIEAKARELMAKHKKSKITVNTQSGHMYFHHAAAKIGVKSDDDLVTLEAEATAEEVAKAKAEKAAKEAEAKAQKEAEAEKNKAEKAAEAAEKKAADEAAKKAAKEAEEKEKAAKAEKEAPKTPAK